MIESPLVREVVANQIRDLLFDLLKDRFEEVPRDVRKLLTDIEDDRKLKKLTILASRADNMEAFKEHLLK
jgi:hypothetical protein